MATSTANFARFAAAVRRKERRIRRNCHGEALSNREPETNAGMARVCLAKAAASLWPCLVRPPVGD
jgi:hypothetical protein